MSDSSSTYPKNEQNMPEIDPAVRRNSRIKLISIFAIFAVPLILASIYLQVVRTSGGELGLTSRGQLIQPAVPLKTFTLNQQEGEFNLDSVRGSWTLLYMPIGECLDVCKLNLYHMRQVRLALNHRMDRVQRAVLLESPQQLSDELIAEHAGLVIATGASADQAVLRGQIAAAEASMAVLSDAVYLIDPFGNVMLRFPPDLPPKSMLKDLKHLLKVSRIG